MENTGLAPRIIALIPSVKFSASIYKKQLSCVMCLELFKSNEEVSFLPSCGHIFHKACIGDWLTDHITCPYDRSSVRIPKASPEGDDE